MNINEKDIILLSDDNSYLVVKKINYNGTNYYCITNVDDNEIVKFLYESNGELIEIEDQKEFENVLASMAENYDVTLLLEMLKRKIGQN